MLEPALHSDFCEEKWGDTPDQTNAQCKTKATHLRCTSDQIKAVPCTAFLSHFNLGVSHSCAVSRNLLSNLPPAQLHKGQQLRANCSKLYTHQKQPDSTCSNCVLVDFKGQDDSCVVLGRLRSSFGLFWKIKEANKKHPYVPPAPPSQDRRTDYCYPYPNALLQITSESMKVHQIFPLSQDSW